LKTENVSAKPQEIIFKLQHEYTPKILNKPKAVNSLISLSLDEQGKVKYHKDMWNEKDYSHEGLGKLFKKLNGDKLTGITKPPDDL
jgi:adenine specific DNA methylase Mod